MRRRNTLFLLTVMIIMAVGILVPVLAQEPAVREGADFPTVEALHNAVVPARDRISLAQRLWHITDIPEPPTSAPVRQAGEFEMFWVSHSIQDRYFQIEAELLAAGEHVYVWAETTSGVTHEQAQRFADRFDNNVYDQARALWGSEPNPGVDGDPRVYALFVTDLGGGAGAYFSSQNAYPKEIATNSNEHEMMVFNVAGIGTAIGDWDIVSIGAHEFQHMIRHHVDLNESSWVDEGSSMFTEAYLNLDSGWWAAAQFLDNNYIQLNHWPENESTLPHYGAGLVFISYLYERFGLEGVQTFSAEPANGWEGVDNALVTLGADIDGETLFADWVLANYLMDTSLAEGQFGYTDRWDNLPLPRLDRSFPMLPATYNDNGRQYAANYFLVRELQDKNTLTLSVDMPSTVQLVPTGVASGRWAWYSNKYDDSDTTLTRAFDLTGVDSATLTYKTWYLIEENWDYAYVVISTDGGATWDFLVTDKMTDTNPNSTNYGTGYTNFSGGWIDQAISLDAYAGQEVLIRFEMITDDAITQPGILIDDVAIPEIGYVSDFEGDNGGWEAAGWIWTDNRLPQQAWVQVVQFAGNDVVVSRWLMPGAQGPWTIDLAEGVSEALVVVAPFAPLTTVPVEYSLDLSAE